MSESSPRLQKKRLAVIIPCFAVREHILDVIASIGPEVDAIYVVDDACPQQTGDHVEQNCNDSRVEIIRHPKNFGVGGAVLTGYDHALADGAELLVKLDGDGQMDPERIPELVAPIIAGEADYTKGNRFHDLEHVRQMPLVRIFGNAVLSFMSKISSGYWRTFDPTNGFTAIAATVARALPFGKISKGYYFESDMLFRLGLLRAAVVDVPIPAVYGNERSNLKIWRIVFYFTFKHFTSSLKRLFYAYFLRDFSVATLELMLGIPFLSFGVVFGVYSWITWTRLGVGAYAGTVMLAALPVITGLQLILAFVSYDMNNVPQRALHPMITGRLDVTRRKLIAPAETDPDAG